MSRGKRVNRSSNLTVLLGWFPSCRRTKGTKSFKNLLTNTMNCGMIYLTRGHHKVGFDLLPIRESVNIRKPHACKPKGSAWWVWELKTNPKSEPLDKGFVAKTLPWLRTEKEE